MAITIIISGLVRDAALFRTQLAMIANLREQGLVDSVYYSTWIGELPRYPELYQPLVEAGAIVIEAPEPGGFRGPHNFYLQSAGLAHALERIADDQIVLRLRPDILAPHRVRMADVVRYIEAEIERPANPLAGLSSRIFVGNLSIAFPFWLEDRFFAGRACDLRRLAHSDIGFDRFVHPDTAIAEVRWFSRPFVEAFALAHDMLRVNWLLGHDIGMPARTQGFRALLGRNPDLQRSLAAYHYIVERNFCVGLPSELFVDRPMAGPEPLPTPAGAIERYEQSSGAGTAYRAALARFRAGDDSLSDGFSDEAALAGELLQLGTLLQPRARVAGPDDLTTAHTSAIEPHRWGVTATQMSVEAGAEIAIAFAWSGVARAGAPLGKLRLVPNWDTAGGLAMCAPVAVPGAERQNGEMLLGLSTPGKPGQAALTLSLQTLDGQRVGDDVTIPVNLTGKRNTSAPAFRPKFFQNASRKPGNS